MTWTPNDCPAILEGLEPGVRRTALEIANRLVDEGYDEGRAIGIARTKAKRIARGEA